MVRLSITRKMYLYLLGLCSSDRQRSWQRSFSLFYSLYDTLVIVGPMLESRNGGEEANESRRTTMLLLSTLAGAFSIASKGLY